MDTAEVDAFIAAVRAIDHDQRPGISTSVRRSPAVGDALSLAVELGLGDSANGMSEAALVAYLRRAAHDLAIRTHYALYPEDRPARAEVALVELRRRGDVLADRADLLRAAEDLLGREVDEPSTIEVIAAARALAATESGAA